MLGEKLRTLADEDDDAGEHTLTIIANNLPGGMYVVTASAGGQVISEKVSIER